MLWRDLSSAPKMKMARHSAFFASRAACPSGSSGELSARRICRYRDSTTGRFRARSSAVAQINPLPPPPFAILPPPCSPRRTTTAPLEREGSGLGSRRRRGSEDTSRERERGHWAKPVSWRRVNGLAAHDQAPAQSFVVPNVATSRSPGLGTSQSSLLLRNETATKMRARRFHFCRPISFPFIGGARGRWDCIRGGENANFGTRCFLIFGASTMGS